MNCNDIGPNLYIVVLFTLTLTLSQWCNAMYRIDWSDKNAALKAVESPVNSLVNNKENEITYVRRMRNHDTGYQNEANAITKRSTIENCLYEELKRRVDKFNNDLAKNPNSALRNHIDNLLVDNEKRATVHECLYEAYKKRLDTISDEVSMDGKFQNDRSGRSSSVIQHTYDDLARRLKMLSQTLQPQTSLHVSPSSIELKPKLTSNAAFSGLFDYDDDDSLVEDREWTSNDDVEVAYDDENSRLFMPVPVSEPVGNINNNTSSYPTVLTKAFEANMDSTANVSPGNLLASVAQKMNTTTLELAQKLTNLTENDTVAMSHDPTLTATLQNYITHAVGVNTTLSQPPLVKKNAEAVQPNQVTKEPIESKKRQEETRTPKATFHLTSSKSDKSSSHNSTEEECEEDTTKKNGTAEQCNMNPILENGGEMMNEETSNRITMILEKVLTKLESLEAKKDNASRKSATTSTLEGAPCEVLGSWHSLGMGIRFDITLGKSNERQLAIAEEGNKLLSITVEECIPPKNKRLVDTDWKFMGSSMQQLGGPFFMYSQRRKDKLLATFTGYCRTCGGIDTIFGSWTFLFPSKDCQDISAAIDNRRDIFRRYKMEVKRKQRFKELLYKNSKMGKHESCKEKDKDIDG